MKILLYTHVVAGFLGLLVGLVAMRARKFERAHHISGQIYFWILSYVCLTGIIIPLINWPKSWWLIPISIFSFSFGLKGWLAQKHRKEGWIIAHIKGMLGSYIALITAFVVANAHRFDFIAPILFWILPTIIGVLMIRRVTTKWKDVRPR